MELIVRRFDALTAREVYEILKARAAVFIMEQQILYQDMDDIDLNSLHMFYRDGDTITAYLRTFPNAKAPSTVQIGRVLTTRRGTGLGKALMQDALAYLEAHTTYTCAAMDAQCYATGFYEKLGFHICSAPFLEEEIMHVRMERPLREAMG